MRRAAGGAGHEIIAGGVEPVESRRISGVPVCDWLKFGLGLCDGDGGTVVLLHNGFGG